MKTIEEEIDEYFVRPLTKIFDGGEAPEGWDIRAKAEKYNRSFHDQVWMIKVSPQDETYLLASSVG